MKIISWNYQIIDNLFLIMVIWNDYIFIIIIVIITHQYNIKIGVPLMEFIDYNSQFQN